MVRKLRTAAAVIRLGGVRYARIFAARRCIAALLPVANVLGDRARETIERNLGQMDCALAQIEHSRGIVEPWAVAARRFTISDNRQWWNDHDWSHYGEEWTPDEAWKTAVLNRFLRPFIRPGGVILEIGPGGGRWSAIIQQLASRLYLLDVASVPLEICRERFRTSNNVEFLLGDGHSIPIDPHSLDAIWSYDVFVHVNPKDAKSYFSEFRRVLRPGGHAIVHHPDGRWWRDRTRQHRSDLTDAMVLEFAADNQLEVILQTTELVNDGDTLTVLRKPDA